MTTYNDLPVDSTVKPSTLNRQTVHIKPSNRPH